MNEALRRVVAGRAAHYDIFLSHTTRDAEVVLGVYDLLTEHGRVVYCDWIDAPETDRSRVTPANAEAVRDAMSSSDTLLFLDTDGADQSLWMCWELGWFDGAKGPVAILPVLQNDQTYYRGREFLGLYPYVEVDELGRLRVIRPASGRTPTHVVEAALGSSRSFDWWRQQTSDFMRPRPR